MAMQKRIVLQNNHDQQHQFSFYSPSFFMSHREIGSVVAMQDEDLVHRVSRVIKLKIKEKFVVFDQKQHALVELISCLKSEIKVLCCSLNENKALSPNITFLLPVLKKEALEEAIYSLAELGVNSIQLISTEKSRREIMEKDMIRLQKMVIAGAEQSKHYAFPLIAPVKRLAECLDGLSLDSDKIVFDISGESFFEIHKKLSQEKVYILIGPEGGLTMQELLQFKKNNFNVCSLTPTVLRALQAAAVGAALFRIS